MLDNKDLKNNDYGPVGGRFSDYNGKCKYDGHESDALVKCTINQYKSLIQ